MSRSMEKLIERSDAINRTIKNMMYDFARSGDDINLGRITAVSHYISGITSKAQALDRHLKAQEDNQ